MRGLPSILSLFCNEFNKFNDTRAHMLDSIYYMVLFFFKNAYLDLKTPFTHHKNKRHYVALLNL